MRGKMDCFGMTDAGEVREVNEDQFLIADLSKSMLIHQTSLSHEDHTRLFGSSQGKLLMVADGMGGHADGKRASSIAVQTVTNYVLNTMSWFFQLDVNQEADLQEELQAALGECQRSLEAASAGRSAERPMGTTLTMAYLLWPRLYVVHAGDSRCYIRRGSRLEQITTDHTMAQQLVERGALPAAEAEQSRLSHILWNCIGGGTRNLQVEVRKARLQLGDTILLCTDGLSKPVTAEQIRQTLDNGGSAEQICRRLVDLANAQGGPDNISVIVAQFRDATSAHHAEEAVTLVEPAEPLVATAPQPAPSQ